MAASPKGRVPPPLPGQAFIVSLRSYIREGFIICYINVIVYVLGTIKETKITNAEKGGKLIMLHPWENSHRLWKLP